MPYIKTELRQQIESELTALANKIRQIDISDAEKAGVVNYALTELLCMIMRPKDGWRYYSLMVAYGTLQCVAAEFYSRAVTPYEAGARARNGDIQSYIGFAAKYRTRTFKEEMRDAGHICVMDGFDPFRDPPCRACEVMKGL